MTPDRPSDDTATRPPSLATPRPRVVHTLTLCHPEVRHIRLRGETVIGRDADLSLPDDRAASRRHARLLVQDGRLRVTDLDSKNGTWRNRDRHRDGWFADGDVLRVGDTLAVYHLEAAERVDAPAPGVLGDSAAARELRAQLSVHAAGRSKVLLLGETGTGKSLAARALHQLSGRRGAFVHVNCGAVAESIAESEFFGRVAGAYTGAVQDAPGYFRAAHQGTLFLDEVGTLSATMQARLLVVLESPTVTPVGSARPIPVDLRIVSATNGDLTRMVDLGGFRQDLFARLSEVEIRLPPLHRRREDVIPLLRRAWGGAPTLDADAAHLLLSWSWPHNVRELESLVQLLKPQVHDLLRPEHLERIAAPPAPSPTPDAIDGPPDEATLVDWLSQSDGNVAAVARRCGRSTKQVYRWLARYGLDPARYRG